MLNLKGFKCSLQVQIGVVAQSGSFNQCVCVCVLEGRLSHFRFLFCFVLFFQWETKSLGKTFWLLQFENVTICNFRLGKYLPSFWHSYCVCFFATV